METYPSGGVSGTRKRHEHNNSAPNDAYCSCYRTTATVPITVTEGSGTVSSELTYWVSALDDR